MIIKKYLQGVSDPMEKRKYYVNLNPISMNNISEVKVDDGKLIEYEIEATEDEIRNLKRLLDEVQAHDMELADLFTFKHFNEEFTEADRKETQEGLNQVFQELYRLGTEETKKALEELQLVNPQN